MRNCKSDQIEPVRPNRKAPHPGAAPKNLKGSQSGNRKQERMLRPMQCRRNPLGGYRHHVFRGRRILLDPRYRSEHVDPAAVLLDIRSLCEQPSGIREARSARSDLPRVFSAVYHGIWVILRDDFPENPHRTRENRISRNSIAWGISSRAL